MRRVQHRHCLYSKGNKEKEKSGTRTNSPAVTLLRLFFDPPSEGRRAQEEATFG